MSKLKDVGKLLVSNVDIKFKTFLHLSFDGELEGIWKPKLPDGLLMEEDVVLSDDQFTEPDWPRISVSISVEGAFRAIYPNVSHYFEEEKYPYMDFFVYSPKGKNIGIMTPKELQDGKYVHDAHITQEHVILEKVEMVQLDKVRIYNTSKDNGLQYRPFNDPALEERYHSPKKIRWTWL